jgi:hypothetical protein
MEMTEKPNVLSMRPVNVYTVVNDGEAVPEPEWLVEGLLTKGSVNLFVGDAGSKKTYALLDLAVCVAMGKPWLGRKTQQASAMILDEESGQARTERRLKQLYRGHDVPVGESLPLWGLSFYGWDLLKPEADLELMFAKFKTWIPEDDSVARLVVIDALAEVMPGGDENSVRDTALVFANLHREAERSGTTYCVIHHANKRGVYRGSSHLKGVVDTMVTITSGAESDRMEFRVTKARDRRGTSFGARIHFDEPEGRGTGAQRVWLSNSEGDPRVTKAGYWVLGMLAASGMLSLGEIEGRANAITDEMTGAMGRKGTYELVEAGLAKRANEGGRGSRAYYTMTEAGVNVFEQAMGKSVAQARAERAQALGEEEGI